MPEQSESPGRRGRAAVKAEGSRRRGCGGGKMREARRGFEKSGLGGHRQGLGVRRWRLLSVSVLLATKCCDRMTVPRQPHVAEQKKKQKKHRAASIPGAERVFEVSRMAAWPHGRIEAPVTWRAKLIALMQSQGVLQSSFGHLRRPGRVAWPLIESSSSQTGATAETQASSKQVWC
ncbi:hypothetical protein BU16DRAFT_561372 [Lophium mytilinum]|uniref:Uncharacterized protein n=1 Tax=Lophium mytilinum TaxID=390894 RepID=A0A6A6QTL0_9PEZI|nr:hypothetical protein BU16DRAFT_561372 [Lophium mytilinum]